ncbi:MAG: hypothetical protein HQK54_04230, partial [Oligoflexales bacterium]|nr:hypothetical protein [Oligoflexales bacterium]
MALLSMTTLYFAYRIAFLYFGEGRARVITLIIGFWYYSIFFCPVLLSESYTQLLIMPAFYCLALHEQKKAIKVNPCLLSGALVSMAVELRLQSALLCIPVFVYLIFKKEYRDTLAFILGFWGIFLIFAILEYFAKGEFFVTLGASRDVNLTREGLILKNPDHWYGYIRDLNIQFSEWLFPFFLLAGILGSIKKMPLIGFSCFGFIACHSLFPHKEIRFIYPVQPILFICAFAGYEYFRERFGGTVFVRKGYFAFLAMLFLISAEYFRGRGIDWKGDASGDSFVLMNKIRNDNDLSRVILVDKGAFLGHFSLHRKVPIMAFLDTNALQGNPAVFDRGSYVIFQNEDEIQIKNWLATKNLKYDPAFEYRRMKSIKIIE